MTTIESQVKSAILEGKSGSISLYAVKEWDESSLSWESFESALKALGAPISLKKNRRC